MQTLRSRRHDLCRSCGRYSYDPKDSYCMACGFSESNPVFGVLLIVGIGILVLGFVGWLFS